MMGHGKTGNGSSAMAFIYICVTRGQVAGWHLSGTSKGIVTLVCPNMIAVVGLPMCQQSGGGPKVRCWRNGFSWHSHGNGRGAPSIGSFHRGGRGGREGCSIPGCQSSGWAVPPGLFNLETKSFKFNVGDGSSSVAGYVMSDQSGQKTRIKTKYD